MGRTSNCMGTEMFILSVIHKMVSFFLVFPIYLRLVHHHFTRKLGLDCFSVFLASDQ